MRKPIGKRLVAAVSCAALLLANGVLQGVLPAKAETVGASTAFDFEGGDAQLEQLIRDGQIKIIQQENPNASGTVQTKYEVAANGQLDSQALHLYGAGSGTAFTLATFPQDADILTSLQARLPSQTKSSQGAVIVVAEGTYKQNDIQVPAYFGIQVQYYEDALKCVFRKFAKAGGNVSNDGSAGTFTVTDSEGNPLALTQESLPSAWTVHVVTTAGSGLRVTVTGTTKDGVDFTATLNAGKSNYSTALYGLMGVSGNPANPADKGLCYFDDVTLRYDRSAEAVAAIEAIGTVTAASGDAIAAARALYDALDTHIQAKVSNYGLLVAAEEAYANLATATPAEVTAMIEALGQLKQLTLADEAKVAAAEAAYAKLSAADQAQVTNHGALTDARALMTLLKMAPAAGTTYDFNGGSDELAQLIADGKAVLIKQENPTSGKVQTGYVVEPFAAFGDSPALHLYGDANGAYTLLTFPHADGYAPSSVRLRVAGSTTNSKNGPSIVLGEQVDGSMGPIYNLLQVRYFNNNLQFGYKKMKKDGGGMGNDGGDQNLEVTDREGNPLTLTAAPAYYDVWVYRLDEAIEFTVEGVTADGTPFIAKKTDGRPAFQNPTLGLVGLSGQPGNAGNPGNGYFDDYTIRYDISAYVKERIDAIGTVTLSSGPAIAAARIAYDALDEGVQVKRVDNYETLVAAEEAYAKLTTETPEAVIQMIDNLGPLNRMSLADEAKIAAAEAAYAKLSAEDQAQVTNYGALTDARALMSLLKTAPIAEAVYDFDDGIGALAQLIADGKAVLHQQENPGSGKVQTGYTVEPFAAFGGSPALHLYGDANGAYTMMTFPHADGYTPSSVRLRVAGSTTNSKNGPSIVLGEQEDKSMGPIYNLLQVRYFNNNLQFGYKKMKKDGGGMGNDGGDQTMEVTDREGNPLTLTAAPAYYDVWVYRLDGAIEFTVEGVAADGTPFIAKKTDGRPAFQNPTLGLVGLSGQPGNAGNTGNGYFDDYTIRYDISAYVKERIEAIGTVTLASGPAIAAARIAYNALDQGVQTNRVTNYDTLVAAEKAYAKLTGADATAAAVIEMISALGDIDALTLADEDKVAAAEAAYAKLSADEQARVTNYDKLVAARARIEWLKEEDSRLNLDAILDFENGEQKHLVCTSPIGLGSGTVMANPLAAGLNTSAQVLRIVPNKPGSIADNPGVFVFKPALMDGTKGIATFSGKFYMNGNENGARPVLVYDFQDDNNWRGITFIIDKTGIFKFRTITMAKGAMTQSGVTPVDFDVDQVFEKDGSKNAMWVSFAMEFSLNTCRVTLNTERGEGRVNARLTYADTNATRCGVTGINQTYFDDLAVSFDAAPEQIQAANFLAKHRYILSLQEYNISNVDEAELQAAQDEYAALEPIVRKGLPLVKEKLDRLAAKLDQLLAAGADDSDSLRDPDDYSEITYAFEDISDLRDWVSVDDYQAPALDFMGLAPVIIPAADGKTGSNLLGLSANTITLKEKCLPDMARITSIRYTAYPTQPIQEEGGPSNYRRMKFFLSYVDENNWQSVDFYWDKADSTGNRPRKFCLASCVNGAISGTPEVTAIDYSKPLTFAASFTAGGNYTYEVSDGFTTLNGSGKLNSLQGKVVLSSPRNAVQIDNLTVKLAKGDWDVDDAITDINAYYTGNTFLLPGDIALINGEKIGSNVTAVEVMQLVNAADALNGRGFVNRTFYDFEGVQPGEFFSGEVTPHTWDAAKAVKVDIIQKTHESVKFVLPTSFSEGVYAVKLYGRDLDADTDDVILYLNAPSVDFQIGDEGAAVTPGQTLRVVGKNLAPNRNDNVRALLIGQSGAVTELDVIEAQSDYAVKLAVPASLADGTYELWLYNGYGDATAWSVPVKVRVSADSVRQAINNQTMYNIRDFGATGSEKQNVTPLVINALTVAAENGGGVIYFPRGIYRFEHSIVLPENVVLKGQSKEDTQFLWTSYRWDVGQMPSYLIGATKNVEIRDISFYATRISGFIHLFGESENVYIENCRTHFQPYAGPASEAPHNVTPLVGVEELRNIVRNEAVNPLITAYESATNLQIKNVSLMSYGHQRSIVAEKGNGADAYSYWQVDGLDANGHWSECRLQNSTWENGEFGENTCLGVWGHGVYFADNTLFDLTNNNRELYVADRGPLIGAGTIQQLADDPSGRTFLIPGSTLSVDALRGTQLYVTNGQGNGQTRHIVSASAVPEGRRIVVDRAFINSPNRNSTVLIRNSRENIYFVDNYFYNGASGGFYGGFADVVYDGNLHERHGNMYQWAYNQDVNWYLSYVNEKIVYDPYFFHSMGTETESGFSHVVFHADSHTPECTRGAIVRRNDFNGQFLWLETVYADALIDCIVEDNLFSNADCAIYLQQKKSNLSINGTIFSRNQYDNIDRIYRDQATVDKFAALNNDLGSRRLILFDNPDFEATLPLGDVNGDGQVTLKDSTLIRNYLIGRATFLTDAQLSRADVDGDGEVTLKDSTAIRYYSMGMITLFPAQKPGN